MDVAVLSVILVFSIPIMAIFLFSPVGKSLAQHLIKKLNAPEISIENIVKSEQLYGNLQERINLLEEEVTNHKASIDLLQKLLVEKKEPKQLDK